jgi:hypothetical protein
LSLSRKGDGETIRYLPKHPNKSQDAKRRAMAVQWPNVRIIGEYKKEILYLSAILSKNYMKD